jgi:hypothetical protein
MRGTTKRCARRFPERDRRGWRSARIRATRTGKTSGVGPCISQPAVVADQVSRQVRRLAEIAAELGAEIHHAKPHGALYNQADRDPVLAAAVADGVARVLPGRAFYVPPGGALAAAGEAAGLRSGRRDSRIAGIARTASSSRAANPARSLK